ncbi:hypothetical protein HHL17_31070 [Chitinophaga sp. G-6-1-13]|uniref:Histidine kinase domain-containing protein n=1 Tax=Chitinophaga fulva TaxID=2728842 RepID=A0A848H1G9_9BACT|nr:ATP-binding protein [Chitinophaga fulva]NML41668.1 hypothetical protein [Chitinophaga fulva]
MLLTLSAIANVCLAATDTLPSACHIQHFDNTNGLPQNTVMAIAPDPCGFIWLSTQDGLVRFDGLRFMTFGMNSLPVASNRFLAFYSNPQGGLSVYNECKEHIRIVDGWPHRDTVAANYPGSYLQWHANNDRLDSGTIGLLGLPEKIQVMGGVIKRLVLYDNIKGVYNIVQGKVGFYEKGVLRYEVPFHHGKKCNFFLLYNRLYYLHDNGTYSALTSKIHTGFLEGDIRADPAFPGGMHNSTFFWNVYTADQAILYFNQSFYLVKATSQGRLTTTRIISGFNTADLGIQIAWYNEQQGKLYLGSNTKGLFILSKQRFYALKTLTGGDSYYGQTAYTKDKILTAQGDMISTHGEVHSIPAIRQRMSSDWYSVFTDSLHHIWLKWGPWVYKHDGKSFQLLNRWRFPAKISIIYDGGDGKMWIGLRGKGIAIMDLYRKNAQPELFLPLKEDVSYFARYHNTMFMSTNKGFYRIDIPSRRIDTIAALRDMYVRSLYVSGPEEVWITTYGKGFFHYYKGQVTTFPLDANKALATAHCIIPDNKGFFWITTNNGLFQVSRADLKAYIADTTNTLYYHYYDKKEGFLTNEFNGGCQPCAVKLDNGIVSLPSLNGLVLFNPDNTHPLLPNNDLFIDKIVADKQEMPVTAHLDLPRKLSQLNITVGSPYMGDQRNLQMSYTLEESGHQSIWLPVPEDGIISLSMLSHGDYTLLIRKQNGFGKDNYQEKRITFSIAAAWYQTSWFMLCVLGCFAGGCFLLMRLRMRYIRKRNTQLEAAVALKTRELQQRTDIQERIIRSVSHDIQTPLKYQEFLSKKLYEGLVTENNPTLTDVARVMHEHTYRLHHMTENLLNYLKVQVEEQPFRTERFPLKEMVDEILLIFKDIAREKGTAIENYIPAELEWVGNSQLLSVVLHNLIDNAVKVTRNGTIMIAARSQHGRAAIFIKDTGPGMKRELVEWLNTGESPIPLRNGIGLMIVRELITLLQLDLFVSSLQDEGCCFCVQERPS